MGSILDFINENNENGLRCYETKKIALDGPEGSVLYNEIDDFEEEIPDYRTKVAETDKSAKSFVKIPEEYLEKQDYDEPLFNYFLDGTRLVYKVGDLPIGSQVYPIIGGQIIVGCCHRESRKSFHIQDVNFRLMLSLPKCLKKYGKDEDFCRNFLEKMNSYLLSSNRFMQKKKLQFSRVVLYDIDGSKVDKEDKDRYARSGISKIQSEMTDQEQLLVKRLCNENKIGRDNWLIKDGSIQYNSNYSFLDNAEWQKMRANYKYVVGVSKGFNPGLIKIANGKPLTRIIAELPVHHRTKAFVYESDMSKDENGNKIPFAVWYVRLRSNSLMQTKFSDVIKCEMLLLDKEIPSNQIDFISANLIHEANPVCYGKDSRWANHLYPVYLTESMCKSYFLNSNLFMNLF